MRSAGVRAWRKGLRWLMLCVPVTHLSRRAWSAKPAVAHGRTNWRFSLQIWKTFHIQSADRSSSRPQWSMTPGLRAFPEHLRNIISERLKLWTVSSSWFLWILWGRLDNALLQQTLKIATELEVHQHWQEVITNWPEPKIHIHQAEIRLYHSSEMN